MSFTPTLWPTAGERFLAHMAEANRLSPVTRRLYAGMYRRLQARYPGKQVQQILQVPILVEYFTTNADGNPRRPGDPGWRENTIITTTHAIRAIVRYGARVGWCDDIRDELAEAFQVHPRNHRQAHWLNDVDLKEVLQLCPDTALGRRDRLIVSLLAMSGLRRAELCALEWSDIDLRARTLHVRKGKGNKERFVGVMPQLAEVLIAWRDQATADLGRRPIHDPVVPAVHPGPGRIRNWDEAVLVWNRPLSAHVAVGAINTTVARAGQRAGIPGLAPHDLRRTFAGILEDAGMPIQKIQAQLGHSSPATTTRYLDQNPRRRADDMADIEVSWL